MFNRFVSILFRFALWLLSINILCVVLEGMDFSIIVAIAFIAGNVYQLLENQWSK